MADITMCSGKGCTKAPFCYRFTPNPAERQSIFVNPPVKTDEDDIQFCKYYWDNEEDWE